MIKIISIQIKFFNIPNYFDQTPIQFSINWNNFNLIPILGFEMQKWQKQVKIQFQ